MGSGMYSVDTYAASATTRSLTGASAFAYHDDVLASTPKHEWKAHQTLDPLDAGIRESRDSVEHPNSVPIAVLCDVTGSMSTYPRIIQSKFPELFNLLLLKGYVEDPQLCFGAIGDQRANDKGPLQVSQFESDNRNDENIENLMMFGGGGGGNHESYELALYFMARHTALDSVEKRGKKGYLFIIGDEECYTEVRPEDVKAVIGDDIDQDIPLDEIIAEVQEKFELFFIIPEDHSARCVDFWRDRLGQNVILLKDVAEICSTIGLTVGMMEGSTTLADGLNDLDASANSAVISQALASVTP